MLIFCSNSFSLSSLPKQAWINADKASEVSWLVNFSYISSDSLSLNWSIKSFHSSPYPEIIRKFSLILIGRWKTFDYRQKWYKTEFWRRNGKKTLDCWITSRIWENWGPLWWLESRRRLMSSCRLTWRIHRYLWQETWDSRKSSEDRAWG